MTVKGSAAISEAPSRRRFNPSNADFLREIAGEGAKDDRLFALGLPTRKLESWKYTNLAPVIKKAARRPGGPAVRLSGDTRFVARVSGETPDWVTSFLMSSAPGREDWGETILWHANTAFCSGVYLIDVPAGEKVATPLELFHNGEDGAIHAPRFIVRIGEGSELIVLEEARGQGAYWALPLVQAFLAEGSRLVHGRFQTCPDDAVYTPMTHIVMAAGAECESLTVTAGAATSRNQLYGELRGKGGRLVVNGVNLLRGSQSGETNVTVRHSAENCFSMQTMKSVLENSARGAFLGSILVDREAQLTDAHQLSNALVLGDAAEMNTKPELEIYADDVKCSHGATTGELDEESLFYLRSRGLPLDEARRLLIDAFVRDLVEQASDAETRKRGLATINGWLERQACG
ncbi:MAG: Fe-S cluster assembly protein SufD [Alphaproteobacteria bacterium]|nr:Fe-S cluster assembly protein SufD [Alphaproteobacteria bacterium]